MQNGGSVMTEGEAVDARMAGVPLGGAGSASAPKTIAGDDRNDYLHGSNILGEYSLLAGFGGDNTLEGGEGIGVADYSAIPLSMVARLKESVFVASLLVLSYCQNVYEVAYTYI
jgi:hypothetical protein